jgi:hypothetical protein
MYLRSTNNNSRWLVLLVFVFFLLLNIISSGGHTDPFDGTETFLVTESMVLKHAAKLDPTVPTIAKLHLNMSIPIHIHKSLLLL